MLVRDKIRNYRPEDLQAAADVFRAADIALGNDRFYTADMIRTYVESPEVDAAKDVFIVERDGRIIGYADLEVSPTSGRSWSDGVVHPDFWRQGVGAELVRVTEARILEKATVTLAPDVPITVQRHAMETSPGEVALLEAQGYQYIRTFYQMRIELDQPVQASPLPAGIVLRPFERDQHAQAVYEAQQEAFADHWGFEPNSFEEWAHFLLDAPEIDFSMWLLAFEETSGEIAGLCVNVPYGEGNPQMAWTRILGVRRAWRKRGLGSALLNHSFKLFQARGYVRAGLGVDASSLTNAVALYERAGMHVHKRTFAYEKTLREA